MAKNAETAATLVSEPTPPVVITDVEAENALLRECLRACNSRGVRLVLADQISLSESRAVPEAAKWANEVVADMQFALQHLDVYADLVKPKE